MCVCVCILRWRRGEGGGGGGGGGGEKEEHNKPWMPALMSLFIIPCAGGFPSGRSVHTPLSEVSLGAVQSVVNMVLPREVLHPPV